MSPAEKETERQRKAECAKARVSSQYWISTVSAWLTFSANKASQLTPAQKEKKRQRKAECAKARVSSQYWISTVSDWLTFSANKARKKAAVSGQQTTIFQISTVLGLHLVRHIT